jgi:hypothetical protein
MVVTALTAEIVDKAILAEESANLLSVLGTGGSFSGILAGFDLFGDSGIGEEV